MADKHKFGGASWRVASARGQGDVRRYDEAPRPYRPGDQTVDPDAVDAPEAQNLDAIAREIDIEREVEEAIFVEEPAQEEDRAYEGAGEPESVATDDPGTWDSPSMPSPWRLRVVSGGKSLEYSFPDEEGLRRFSMRSTVDANDLVSSDGGGTWMAAWQLGLGRDGVYGDFLVEGGHTPTHTFSRPRPVPVRWGRVSLTALGLSLVTYLVLNQAETGSSRSLGVFESPIGRWYDAAIASILQAPRPPLVVPMAPTAPLVAVPASKVGRPETDVRIHPSTDRDHASVGADALSRGAWGEAARAYRKALQLAPENPDHQRGLAEAMQGLLESTRPVHPDGEPVPGRDATPDSSLHP